MLRKLLPLILLLLGTGAGIGAGILTAPAHPGEVYAPEAEEESHGSDGHGETSGQAHDFVKLNNQFVVPLIQGDKVTAMVVLSLSLETKPGLSDTVFTYEPKLRDVFLRVLFDHANAGGFRGAFTQSGTLDLLRQGLREAAQKEMGDDIFDVLIVDIARQDV